MRVKPGPEHVSKIRPSDRDIIQKRAGGSVSPSTCLGSPVPIDKLALVIHMELGSLYRHKNNVTAAILQLVSSLPPLPSHGPTFCGATQATSALVAHKIAAFRQEEMIDRPSMETRFLNKSKQTWKSRPAESLVSPYPLLGRQSRISCICGQTRPPPLPRIARLLQKRCQR